MPLKFFNVDFITPANQFIGHKFLLQRLVVFGRAFLVSMLTVWPSSECKCHAAVCQEDGVWPVLNFIGCRGSHKAIQKVILFCVQKFEIFSNELEIL